VLENLMENHIFPDGTSCEQTIDMSENKFAIYDVNNDGKEELLLMYNTAPLAGQTEYIISYGEKTKELQTELSEFPLLTFYDNGFVKAGCSHNQGLAGDFWSYSLYQYKSESNSYELIGMVDAWQKSFSATDNQKHPFPDEIDKSKTGFVYYIMEDGKYDNTNLVDASVYNKWMNTYIGDASEIDIQYLDVTEENISKIKNGL